MINSVTIPKHVLEFDNENAQRFFLKVESYASLNLPAYITFENILANVDKILKDKDLLSFKHNNPRKFDGLNHIIFSNKDGKYAWCPFQLIHPALYVSLVHKITKPDYWVYIQRRFNEFSQNKKIICASYPVESSESKKDRAKQVLNWWSDVEQCSIVLALDYEYLIQTDITDCYGAIYTHSIAWALHDKSYAKKKKDDKNLIGNIIDNHLQDMQYGQTNGIPQGSVLMDFIAEIVLGYADLQLSQKIQDSSIENYHIIRYRDDYRIFVNNPADGENIVKLLTEILISLGLKINATKTFMSHQVIRDSIKSDKFFWINQKKYERNIQKHLLLIYDLATRYSNSGSLITALTRFRKHVQKHVRQKKLILNKNTIVPLISIIVDIAYHNPKTYAITLAILSDFFNLLEDYEKKRYY